MHILEINKNSEDTQRLKNSAQFSNNLENPDVKSINVFEDNLIGGTNEDFLGRMN